MNNTITSPRKIALIMGVANQRSIAWACVQSFLQNFDCILTYQNERFQPKVERLIASLPTQQQERHRILGCVPCNVETELPILFSERIPELLLLQNDTSTNRQRKLDAIVHSIAYADFEGCSLAQASWKAFAQAQHISAYSFLETAQCALNNNLLQQEHQHGGSSLTALTYLGAVRAVPNYHIMGPAKASLEAIVRGLAFEFGQQQKENNNNIIRVNAVSAGPLPTLAARGGIPSFAQLYQRVGQQAPLGHVTADQVADTVRFLATDGTGITGQTIYVDGGFSSIVPL